jgi:hypothetical protein
MLSQPAVGLRVFVYGADPIGNKGPIYTIAVIPLATG